MATLAPSDLETGVSEPTNVETRESRAANHIVFIPNDRLERTHTTTNRRRSASRDSISSVRSRARSAGGIPIEFRTLSFGVAESHAIAEKKREARRAKENKNENEDYFSKLDFHLLTEERLFVQLGVKEETGLGAAEASTRLAKDGPNTFPGRRQNYAKKLFFYIFGGFCSVLWVGVLIFFICWRPLGDPHPAPYNLGLAILVLIVIFLQASFSAFQDWSTARTMKSILNLLPAETVVIRDGESRKINTADLVVGDVVKVSIGNKVPADIRLVSTSGDVRFDRSMLTGESEEIEGSTSMTDKNFLETRNVALMGTMVTNGSATGVVVLAGGNTVMGRIAKATGSVKDQPTLIQREINRFVRIIVGLTVVLATAILATWAGWLRVDHPGYMNVVAMLNNVMGCVVAFIPEGAFISALVRRSREAETALTSIVNERGIFQSSGMPVGVALTLMVVARRMRSHNILPKGLSTVETLGCVNVLCSDKTGTLTENKMVVTTVCLMDKRMLVDEALQAISKDVGLSTPLNELHRAAVLCNDANFDPLSLNLPVQDREVQGNATDGATLKFCELAREGCGSTINDAHPRVFHIPFNSKNKWMLTLHKIKGAKEDSCEFLMLVKGAPDFLQPYCTSYWSGESNSILPFDEAAKTLFKSQQEIMSRNGERVILLCQRTISTHELVGSNSFANEIHHTAMADLTIVGLLGITDPPRKETAATVAACRRAGIRFFMVTGDFGLTAAAIARSVGIFTNDADPDTIRTINERRSLDLPIPVTEKAVQPLPEDTQTSLILEGPSISELLNDDWDIVCNYQEIVFARTSPEQKLRIVKEFKARGNAVAVTGDGVNDAPALRAADVGIAVVTGSDVALEAADLVLLDKFDAIIDAIRMGRLVFQNLQKVISYLLPAGSWSEIWPVLMNVYFGCPLPLSSFLMIMICVFTDLFLSLSLIMEKEEFDLLELRPRNHKKDHLINLKIYAQSYLFIGVMETICAHAMFFLYMYKYAHLSFHDLIFAFAAYTDGFHGYTQAELTNFNTTGQCVYFVTLVILQWGNILSIRNKRLSILQADPIRKERRNPYLLAGAAISLAIAVFVTEEPGIQRIFGTASVPIEFWLIPVPLAVGILVMDEARKLVVRMWPKGLVARIAW